MSNSNLMQFVILTVGIVILSEIWCQRQQWQEQNSLRHHQKEILKGVILKRELTLFWVTPDSQILNHYSIQV